jgi:hypothetical protein
MTQGIFLALSAAFVYGFLGVCYEIAAKRNYRIWDVILYMQFMGFVIGLTLTALRGLPFYGPRLLAMGLLGAMTFVGSLGCYLPRLHCRDRRRLPKCNRPRARFPLVDVHQSGVFSECLAPDLAPVRSGRLRTRFYRLSLRNWISARAGVQACWLSPVADGTRPRRDQRGGGGAESVASVAAT